MTIVYSRDRFPPDVIQYAVWLYARFALSYRDVEDLLAERGIEVSYESIRCWVAKFGALYARRIRRSRPTPNTRWHLDEMFVSMRGGRVYLWRAVDDEGEVLEVLVQRRRDAKAALRLIRKLLRKQGYCPSAVVTDRLRSYHSALRALGLNRLHNTGRWTNNRAEVSHQPVRRRERQRRGFRSPGLTQRFLAVHAAVYNLFNVQRHLISRRVLRQFRSEAFRQWPVSTAVAA